MKLIKSILFKFLPLRVYLTLLQKGFYLLYDLNFLKNKEEFKYHYAIKKIIKPNYTVIDIGANLGYYSKNFARLAHKGKVIAIEPLPLFYSQLKKLLSNYKHVEIINCALGDSVGTVTMVLPTDNGMIRTGLPHIASENEEKKEAELVEVEIRKGSEILNKQEKIDYIKCDIEGYELFVFKEIFSVLEKYRPIIQIEVAEKNKDGIFEIFHNLNYSLLVLKQNNFFKADSNEEYIGDYFFVPKEKENEFIIN